MNVLVALDGSEGAFAALRTCCRIAARSRATVTALYVNKGHEYTPEETGWTGIVDRIASELEAAGRRVIEEARAIGRAEATDVGAIVRRGVPAAGILNYAHDHGIVKLIAVGRSDKGRAAEGFVGSTARTVVALAKVPVLVTGTVLEIGRIVLAVDDPASARKAAAFAGTLAELVGAGVRILSVVPSAETIIAVYRQIAEVRGLSRYVEEAQRAYDRMGEEASAVARDVLESSGVRCETSLRQGRPAEEILAEVGRDDLLAIGLRPGPTGRRLGSVASTLLGSPTTTVVFV
ncbi:MAG TPA: universal stress protein [Anaeromyxobacter sp.]|nr:universal stress protein [Anaeromyxobacter sp.]